MNDAFKLAITIDDFPRYGDIAQPPFLGY